MGAKYVLAGEIRAGKQKPSVFRGWEKAPLLCRDPPETWCPEAGQVRDQKAGRKLACHARLPRAKTVLHPLGAREETSELPIC